MAVSRAYAAATQAALFYARQAHRVPAVISALKPHSNGISVTAGQYVQNVKNAYVAQNTGTTGAISPTHTAGVKSDGASGATGGIKWLFVNPKSLVRITPTTPK